MMSSESEEQVPRKRTRTSNSDEDGTAGGKKARGRPRVDMEDATAADRRRTQIRLAQRAYRQRKETTIASLNSQCSQLRSIIEQMNKTFGRLNELAQESGLLQLNPALAREFKHVTEKFCGLVKTASEGEYEGNEEQVDPADKLKECYEERVRHKPPESDLQSIGWGYSIPLSSSEPDSREQPCTDNFFTDMSSTVGHNVTTSHLVRHRKPTIGDTVDQQNVSLPQRPSIQTSSQSQQLPFGLLDLSQQQASYTPSNSNPQVCSVTIPTPEGTPPMMRLPTPQPNLSLPTMIPSGTRTYSFEETNFARRLTRRAIEIGFQLLSTTNVCPAVLHNVFRLSFSFLTPDQIRTRFKLMLSRGTSEDLEWWETPFIQIGGAGTHYSRRDAAGRVATCKNAWKIRSRGPLDKKSATLENAIDGRIGSLDGVDLSDLQGEWFDAHDVQGYLEEEYACKLDPDSSFAECLVDEDDDDDGKSNCNQTAKSPYFGGNTRRSSHERRSAGLSNSSTNSATSSISTSTNLPPQTSSQDLPGTSHFGLNMNFAQEPTPTIRGGEFQKLVDYDFSFDQTLGLDLAPGFDYGFSNDSGMGMPSTGLSSDMMDNTMASVPLVRQKRKKIVTVDVSRLIDETIRRGVCLGRAPGFRRKDVDVAVRAAAISTY